MNRITIAMLLNTVHTFSDRLKEPIQLLASPSDNTEGPRKSLEIFQPRPSSDIIESRTRFQMKRFRILLFKEKKSFVELSLRDTAVMVDAIADQTQNIGAKLRALDIVYTNGVNWTKLYLIKLVSLTG